MVAHAYKRTKVQGHPGLHSDSLFEKKKDKFQKLQLRINYGYLRILLRINFMLNVLKHTQMATRKLGGDMFITWNVVMVI